MSKGYILGISCGYHDSAASLIKDGKVLGAVEEERFTGIKHDSSFPLESIKWLYSQFKVNKDDVDAICFYETPDLKLDRIETSTKRGGIWEYFTRRKIISRNKNEYKKLDTLLNVITGEKTKVVFSDHHLSHVAYSYYTSPFKKATILSVDGVGEWETTSMYYGEDNNLTKIGSVSFPHSLGMLYSTITAFLGFKPNEGEYKVMGLAPYGDSSKYEDKFTELVSKTNDSFEINMDYFTYDYSDELMFNEKLGELFGITNRLPEDELTQDHKDIAASLQVTYEKILFHILDKLYIKKPTHNLCLSGGCAYNGTANGKIINKTNYKKVYIPPAPSDAGSAIGCALHYYYSNNKDSKRIDNSNPFLGPYYNDNQIKSVLEEMSKDVYYQKCNYSELIPIIARQISEGNVIGWFQGRLEFGARALGNRSIFANPRDPQMKSRVNRVIKKREGFRPFAPIVKLEDQSKYFEYPHQVPYMNHVVKVKEEHQQNLPAITHVDGSARIQSLKRIQQPNVYKLLTELHRINEYPIVLNTSFNLKDQTMVLDPKSAIQTFLNCEMDTLVIHNYIIKKKIL
jgi:carbamoyltransferase